MHGLSSSDDHVLGEGSQFKGDLNEILWQDKASFCPFDDHSLMCPCRK